MEINDLDYYKVLLRNINKTYEKNILGDQNYSYTVAGEVTPIAGNEIIKGVDPIKGYNHTSLADGNYNNISDLSKFQNSFLSTSKANLIETNKQIDNFMINVFGIPAGDGIHDMINRLDYNPSSEMLKYLGENSPEVKANLEKFFANAPADKIEPTDYELAVKVLTKFPGSEAQAATYLEKAIATDTSRINKLNYMQQGADMYAKAKNPAEQLNWMKRMVELKGTTTEGDYYRITAAALSAKDYPQTIDWAKKYMAAFPDKPQPYTFYRKAAIASDPDTTSGKGVEQLQYIDSIYNLNKDKYKKELFLNKYYTILYYINKQNALKKSPEFKVKSDGTKTEVVDQFLGICQKSLEVTDKMIELYPDVADDNNKFAQSVKGEIQKNIDYYSKPPVKKPGAPAAPPKG
jgi:hypothetical protein